MTDATPPDSAPADAIIHLPDATALPAADPNALAALSAPDRDSLATAVLLLESPGVAVRIAELVGTPVEVLLRSLPDAASRSISKASEIALRRVLAIALATMSNGKVPPSDRFHKFAVFTSGAIGGAAGLPGLAIELPITTGIMFRSIADIARAEGEDLRATDTMLACMQVFALGGPGDADDAADSAYLLTRLALSKSIADVSATLGARTLSAEAPAVVRLITKLAARFGIVVSYKTAAQLAPIIGAIGGATVNTLFMAHYQNIARGHFTVRRLEGVYGSDTVQSAYRQLRLLQGAAARPTSPNSPRKGPVIAAGEPIIDLPPFKPEGGENR